MFTACRENVQIGHFCARLPTTFTRLLTRRTADISRAVLAGALRSVRDSTDQSCLVPTVCPLRVSRCTPALLAVIISGTAA